MPTKLQQQQLHECLPVEPPAKSNAHGTATSLGHMYGPCRTSWKAYHLGKTAQGSQVKCAQYSYFPQSSVGSLCARPAESIYHLKKESTKNKQQTDFRKPPAARIPTSHLLLYPQTSTLLEPHRLTAAAYDAWHQHAVPCPTTAPYLNKTQLS